MIIFRRLIIAAVTVVCLGVCGFLMFNRPPADIPAERVIAVNPGATLSGISAVLERDNLIRSRYFFMFMHYLKRGTIKSGTYAINSNYTTLDVLKTLHSGKSVSRKVTIPEGSNIYEIAVLLEEAGITSGKRYIQACSDITLLNRAGIASKTFEGYLFPDTYYFSINSSPESIISVMHGRFRKIYMEIKGKYQSERVLSDSSYLKLASLIEEEARIPEERKYISSVFHNRLQRDMKLDCDPTVRYAVKKFRGKIYYRDLDSDSPYNTYVHKGLPPTPITNPGRSSIIAAFNPAHTDYLFFVARNDGSHYFSEKLSEHNRAVQRFQRGKNNGFIDRQRLE